ncbi:MAG: heterodisulfide reductase-related iron-sulfur binding cluster [Promethearchaeota archaeon]
MQEKTGLYIYPEKAKKTALGWAQKEDRIIKGDPDKPAFSLGGLNDAIPWEKMLGGSKLFEGMSLIMGGSYCCRAPETHMCDANSALDNLPNFVKNLADTGFKEIVFYHDACYGFLTTQTLSKMIEVPFKPIHLLQYLRGWLQDHRDLIKPLNLKVAYQRPCTTRYNPHGDMKDGFFDWVEDIFKLIGCELVDRKYQRENAMCCGSGIFPTQHERAMKYVNINLQDAKDAGAEAYITFCPVCNAVMRQTSKKKFQMEPYHIIMLVQSAIGEELPLGGAAIGSPVH